MRRERGCFLVLAVSRYLLQFYDQAPTPHLSSLELVALPLQEEAHRRGGGVYSARTEEKDEDNETYTTCGLSSSVSSTGPDESDTVLDLMRLLRRARPFANAQQRVVASGAAHVANAQRAPRDNTS